MLISVLSPLPQEPPENWFWWVRGTEIITKSPKTSTQQGYGTFTWYGNSFSIILGYFQSPDRVMLSLVRLVKYLLGLRYLHSNGGNLRRWPHWRDQIRPKNPTCVELYTHSRMSPKVQKQQIWPPQLQEIYTCTGDFCWGKSIFQFAKDSTGSTFPAIFTLHWYYLVFAHMKFRHSNLSGTDYCNILFFSLRISQLNQLPLFLPVLLA